MWKKNTPKTPVSVIGLLKRRNYKVMLFDEQSSFSFVVSDSEDIHLLHFLQ